MEMICIMHEAEPRGYLLVHGKALTIIQLARLSGASPKMLASCLRELQEFAVVCLDENGVMYSRRMVNDTIKSLKGQEYGKRGGNPNLKVVASHRDNPRVNPGVKGEGYTKNIEYRSKNPQSLSQGSKVDDFQPADKRLYEAAEEMLSKNWPKPAISKTRLEAFRKDLTNAVGSHAPENPNASFAPIARLIIDGFDPITKILRPAREIAYGLSQGYKVTSWNFYASAISNQTNDRAAS
jgi:hypothetical protein